MDCPFSIMMDQISFLAIPSFPQIFPMNQKIKKAYAIPLQNHVRKSERRDLNPRHPPWQGGIPLAVCTKLSYILPSTNELVKHNITYIVISNYIVILR